MIVIFNPTRSPIPTTEPPYLNGCGGFLFDKLSVGCYKNTSPLTHRRQVMAKKQTEVIVNLQSLRTTMEADRADRFMNGTATKEDKQLLGRHIAAVILQRVKKDGGDFIVESFEQEGGSEIADL
jgi:hypothetical protein